MCEEKCPLCMNCVPNAKTIEAMEELERGEGEATSVEELFAGLDEQ